MKLKPKGFNRGEIGEDVLLLGALIIIIFVFIVPSRKLGPVQNIFSLENRTQGQYTSDDTNELRPDSNYARSIQVNSGNAQYESDPFREYVTIDNQGDNTVNITGWALKNNKSNKTFESSGNIQRLTSDVITLPKVATFISPTGNNNFVDIILKNDDRVIVSSGATGIRSPYAVVSFRENKCSGYLERLPEYEFTPQLETNCPDIKNEPGYGGLDRACKDYISGMSSCYTPKFDGVDQDKQACTGCVDGKATLANSCVNFLKQHATYEMCIAKHQYDSDFNLKTVRVFMGRSFEMWDRDDEAISLYDNLGKLVNYKSY